MSVGCIITLGLACESGSTPTVTGNELDLSQDYLIMDGLETITLKTKLSEGNYSSTVVESVERREVTEDDLETIATGHVGKARDDLLNSEYAVFHMWRVPLNAALIGLRPSRGSVVVDSMGISWTIKIVKKLDWDLLDDIGQFERYRCVGLREVK